MVPAIVAAATTPAHAGEPVAASTSSGIAGFVTSVPSWDAAPLIHSSWN
jgi:hypothetical protein